MDELAECLFYKRGDQSLMPRSHVKAEGSWGSCNASADGKRSDRSLTTGQPA